MAYINLQRMLELNQDKGDVMAQKALDASGASRAIRTAQTGIARMQQGFGDASQAVGAAQGMSRMLGDTGGLAGAGNMSALDAALAGRSGTMSAYRQRTGNLQRMLTDTQGAMERQRAADEHYRANIDTADRRQAELQQREAAREEKFRREATAGARDSNKKWRAGRYDPKTPEEYAAYSDYIQSGGR